MRPQHAGVTMRHIRNRLQLTGKKSDCIVDILAHAIYYGGTKMNERSFIA